VLVQIVEDHLEALLDLVLGRQGKCLDLPNSMTESWTLLPQLPKLLCSDVCVDGPIEMEHAPRNLCVGNDGGDGRPDWTLEVNQIGRSKSTETMAGSPSPEMSINVVVIVSIMFLICFFAKKRNYKNSHTFKHVFRQGRHLLEELQIGRCTLVGEKPEYNWI